MLIKFLDGLSREIENLSRADLSFADLSGANLSRANLSFANLSDARLSRADLSRADLSDADLSDANLSATNLSDANLSGAILSRANLSGTTLPANYKIARLDFGGWSICVNADKTSIGCQTRDNTKWLKADPRWISALDENATDWWQQHGAAVQAVIRDVMAQNQE